ncbi:TolC family outer membrane protein [Pseudomonas sp. ABC1]|uniref:TolC family outer membrane protein n=1 Tax=Pseudomonas sp. ABC1 TaxID=2748080 RepID=UPI0015C3EB4F|nr:TolC family outer membrane protein [Pseudomonas sp. ABC1]QLF93816.1 TolC family outer membrane protein [Pseudomonas sp. ABC1]
MRPCLEAVAFAALCCLSFPSHALGLLDAYALALRNDPTLQAAISEHQAGQEHRAIGRAALLPRLDYRYTNSRNESEVTQQGLTGEVTNQRDYRSYASVVSLQQPLFDYAAWTRYRQGEARALLADERLRGRGQELMVRLFQAYSEALLAGERIALAQAQRSAYTERLQLNRRLFEGGEGTRTDLLETQARHDLSLAQEIEANDALDIALRELQAIIGEPLLLEDLTPLLAAPRFPPLHPQGFEAWRDLALASNAELAAQRHALSVAEQQVEQARANHMPSLSLVASSRLTRSDSESSYNQRYDTDSIGIQLNLPLFAGGANSASRRQAARQFEQASHELDAQSAGTLNELRRQYNLCRSAQAKIRAYQMAEASAATLVEATRKSVLGGERVNLDVLDAQAQLYNARRDLADARHGYLLAWLQLRYLAGQLGERDLAELAEHFARPDV